MYQTHENQVNWYEGWGGTRNNTDTAKNLSTCYSPETEVHHIEHATALWNTRIKRNHYTRT